MSDYSTWQMVTTVIGAIFALIGGLGIYILNDLKSSVKEATESVSRLSGQFLVVVERGERHEVEISKIKDSQEIAKEKFHEMGNHISRIKAHMQYCPSNTKGKSDDDE